MWGVQDGIRDDQETMKKLDDALTVARKALAEVDKAKDIAGAKEVALRARVKLAEMLK